MTNFTRRLVGSLRRRLGAKVDLDSLPPKGRQELGYWVNKRTAERRLRNDWYLRFYTEHFGLLSESFRGLRVLDVGCGPRGSLEWAAEAALRIGLDPLALEYRALGTRAHRMSYVAGIGERIPIRDDSVDLVSAFNSLDHADEPTAVAAEITRVVRPGGTVLVLVDINHEPTDSEPVTLDWDVAEALFPHLVPVAVRPLEKRGGVYQSVLEDRPFDHSAGSDRPGVLSLMLRKPSAV